MRPKPEEDKMKTRLRLVALALAVTGAAAGPAEAHGSAAHASTLKFHGQIVSTRFVDNAPTASAGPGDELVESENVSRGGKIVGHTLIVCTIVTPSFDSECAFTLTLPHGSLQYAGRGTTQRTERFAVVGGTGAYAKARGMVVTKQVGSDGSRHELTFHL
jgi:hypothetical protein